VKRLRADIENFGFLEMNLDASQFKLVKLHLPPPDIRIFSPIFFE
jgi:hypothetical protein